MSQTPLEKDLERKVVAYAKSVDVLCYKFSSPSHRGVPDRVLLGPNGKVGFLELKRLGQRPTALQLHILNLYTSRNVNAAWVDNLESAKRFIDSLL